MAFNEKIIQNIQTIEFKETSIQNKIITIGIPNTLTYTHKEKLLWLIKKNNPGIKIKIIENQSFEIINLVNENKIDFGVTCIDFSNNSISKVNLYADPFCVAFYKGHKFQSMKEVDIELVRKEDNYIFRNTCEFFYYSYLKEYGKFPSENQIQKIIKKRKSENKRIETLYLPLVMLQQHHVLKVVWVLQSFQKVSQLIINCCLKELQNPFLNRNIFFIQNNKNISKINTTNEALKNALWL